MLFASNVMIVELENTSLRKADGSAATASLDSLAIRGPMILAASNPMPLELLSARLL